MAKHFNFLYRSGSYMELRKAYVAVELVKSATLKSGGCYMFSNLRGCDGERVRLYFLYILWVPFPGVFQWLFFYLCKR